MDSLFIQVFTTKKEEDFLVAKSLLDDSGIQYNTRDEKLQDLWIGENLSIEVTRENADKAREILKDFIIGTPAVPNDKQKDEFNFAASIGGISLVILLI